MDGESLIQKRIQAHANRQQQIKIRLGHILRTQRLIESSTENVSPKDILPQETDNDNLLRTELDLLGPLTEENDSSQQKIEQSVIKSTIKKELKQVKFGGKQMVDYGVDVKTKIRHILLMLSNRILPLPQTMKRCIFSDANYGSFANAEMLLALFLEFFQMKLYNWKQEEHIESLLRSFNSIVRFAPRSSLSMYYYEFAGSALKEFMKSKSDFSPERLVACVIYNTALSLTEDITEEDHIKNELEDIKAILSHYIRIGNTFYKRIRSSLDSNNKQNVYDGVRKLCNEKVKTMDNIRNAYERDNADFLIRLSSSPCEDVDEDDIKSVISSFSSTDTAFIDVEFTDLAFISMTKRNVDEIEVKRCLKYGEKKASKEMFKVTDDNLILFYKKVGRVPLVMNVYRHFTVSELSRVPDTDEKFVACFDTLLTVVLYEDYRDYYSVVEMMLKMGPVIDKDEKEALTETLKHVFMDGLPSYHDLLYIIPLMKHFGL